MSLPPTSFHLPLRHAFAPSFNSCRNPKSRSVSFFTLFQRFNAPTLCGIRLAIRYLLPVKEVFCNNQFLFGETSSVVEARRGQALIQYLLFVILPFSCSVALEEHFNSCVSLLEA